MANTKTFSVAGISTHKSVTKVRFANDFVARIKILDKNQHTDVELIELGGEFTKAEVAQILLAHPKFQNEAAQGAIAEYVTRNVKGEAAKAEAEQPAVTAEFEDALI